MFIKNIKNKIVHVLTNTINMLVNNTANNTANILESTSIQREIRCQKIRLIPDVENQTKNLPNYTGVGKSKFGTHRLSSKIGKFESILIPLLYKKQSNNSGSLTEEEFKKVVFDTQKKQIIILDEYQKSNVNQEEEKQDLVTRVRNI